MKYLKELKAIFGDGKKEPRFWLAGFYFVSGIAAWLTWLSKTDPSMLVFTGLDFALAARYGAWFWRNTENQRRVRRWKRARDE